MIFGGTCLTRKALILNILGGRNNIPLCFLTLERRPEYIRTHFNFDC